VKKLVILMLMLWPFAVTHDASAAEKITSIANAGIICSGNLPPRIAQRYVTHVKRACEHRVRCSVRATSAAGSRRLMKRHGCTGFFVVTKCSGAEKEFRSNNIKRRLRVSC
jgi:hypothetical protein